MDSKPGRLAVACDAVLRWIVFASVSLAVLVGPWLFGAWEAWWFWPIVAAISVGFAATGVRLGLARSTRVIVSARVWWILAALTPFVVYAVIRMFMADVFMDAQRSVLLHVTAICVAGEILFGLNATQRRLLFWLLFANLLLLGVYGLVNHVGWQSERVLWEPGYAQYAGRATGPYFCPDHFAGAMELLLCLALGLLASRGGATAVRWLAGLAALAATVGVVLTQSRGGGMTVIVIFMFAMVWCVAQWPAAIRWNLRLIGVSASLLLFMGLCLTGSDFVNRFVSYGGWGSAAGSHVDAEQGKLAHVVEALQRTSRGRMYGGAVRAWKSAPWFGIGPGMHQHLWPHFAPTPDGDPELRIWPTLHNYDFRSYEVHSDWLQLLEEYGVVGMILFLFAFGVVMRCFAVGVRDEGRKWQQVSRNRVDPLTFSCWVGGALSAVAMAFHSLGDFNLQMPGTVWVFSAILAIAVGQEGCSVVQEARAADGVRG
ncbi:MAG: O-antigen ligase family protein [Verrucomicrobia bacterium]|nr:O-antigen ligase family protein [Verrucomicrobiota bacterium]